MLQKVKNWPTSNDSEQLDTVLLSLHLQTQGYLSPDEETHVAFSQTFDMT